MILIFLTPLKKRSKLLKMYYANPSMINKEQLNTYSKYCSEMITDSKEANSYWSIINSGPRLPFNDTLISDLKQKTGLFGSNFSSQCAPVNTSSKLHVFLYKTKTAEILQTLRKKIFN